MTEAIANQRSGKKWNVNELLNLQREYELLELSVQEIAVRHKRSVNSILYKLEGEGFISSWNEARGFDPVTYENSFSDNVVVAAPFTDDQDVSVTSDDVCNLCLRVNNLESSISQINTMVKQMFEFMMEEKKLKNKALSKF
jgi:hypothetical protein